MLRWYGFMVEILDAKVALFELIVWPHEVDPWFHSLYRGRARGRAHTEVSHPY